MTTYTLTEHRDDGRKPVAWTYNTLSEAAAHIGSDMACDIERASHRPAGKTIERTLVITDTQTGKPALSVHYTLDCGIAVEELRYQALLALQTAEAEASKPAEAESS